MIYDLLMLTEGEYEEFNIIDMEYVLLINWFVYEF